ncbi:MAG: shufflon system plasmid conjugative transfer pilus tip adhesin PilV [Muribaculaceae bacterium]|nr:shufflon system plasmid conjugative transfer pilus tip adhesin PilV [Muribaculaceae bacterium]
MAGFSTYSSNRWFARGGGSGVSSKTSWREFAFTDSNVASATNADMLDGYHISNYQTGGWYGMTPYVYDATNGTRYYWHKIATIGAGSGHAVIELIAQDDANFASFQNRKLAISNYNNGSTKTVTLSGMPHLRGAIDVMMTTSGEVWVRFRSITWTCYAQFRLIYGSFSGGGISLHTNPVRQEATPSGSNVISDGGSIRLENGSFGYGSGLTIAANATSAAKLQTARTLWGQSFNGEGNVSGDMTGVGKIVSSYSSFPNFELASTSSECSIYYNNNKGQKWAAGAGCWGANGFAIGEVSTDAKAHFAILLGGNVAIGATTASEKLTVNGWVGTIGASGWYNITYGGGLHMIDSVWIRSYNSKGLYLGTGTFRTDGQIQVGSEGSKFHVDSTGAVSAAGRVTAYSGLTVPKSKGLILGNIEIAQWSDDCLTIYATENAMDYLELEGDFIPYNSGGEGQLGRWDYFWGSAYVGSINSYRLRIHSSLDESNNNYGELLWDNTNKAIYTKQGFYSTQWIATRGAAETSDMRMKRVIAPVELSVAQLAAAPLFLFEWRDGDSGVFVGTSAQYWEKVLPQLVIRLGGTRQLFYENLGVAAGIVNSRAIERLTTRHDRWLGKHETRIQRLERENRETQKENRELRKEVETLKRKLEQFNAA